jgi:hypothetical protein
VRIIQGDRRAEIEVVPEVFRLGQLIQNGRRRDGEGDPFRLHLFQEYARVERLVQDQRAGVQHAGEQESAERAHIDQRKRVQQPVAILVRACRRRIARDGEPHVVRTRHALRGAGGAGGPADRQHRIGIHRVAAFVVPQPVFVGRPTIRIDGQGFGFPALRRPERKYRYAGRHGSPCIAGQAQVPDPLDRDHARRVQDRRGLAQFMAPVLHGDWRQDGPDRAGGVVNDHQFRDVGQLHDQRVVRLDAPVQQLASQIDRGVLQLPVVEPQGLGAGPVKPVGLIGHGRAFRMGRAVLPQQSVQRCITPPALAGELGDSLGW